MQYYFNKKYVSDCPTDNYLKFLQGMFLQTALFIADVTTNYEYEIYIPSTGYHEESVLGEIPSSSAQEFIQQTIHELWNKCNYDDIGYGFYLYTMNKERKDKFSYSSGYHAWDIDLTVKEGKKLFAIYSKMHMPSDVFLPYTIPKLPYEDYAERIHKKLAAMKKT